MKLVAWVNISSLIFAQGQSWRISIQFTVLNGERKLLNCAARGRDKNIALGSCTRG
jgi:hypothetical protein